ncbi:MAG: YjgP/YjgQ family permease [Planctomycetes bacterium]|nr:YjgP/YjgQ family permease [Planctomycetota bacterium]
MVFTLHRYIFRELMKIFILAVVALSMMTSLASILQPIQEFGAAPIQVLHLVWYFFPVTLTFILPMAALFACSMVYGRFASDNELDACRASGVSLLTLVYPGLVLAIIVAMANLLLSFYVMPAFVQKAETSLKADAQQIIFRNIKRKGYYTLPPDKKVHIYADYADEENSILTGVIITELGEGRIGRIITAKTAKINFIIHDRFNEVEITAYDTHQMGFQGEGGFSTERLALSSEFGSLVADDIMFKKIDEMKNIQANPMLFYPVEKLARQAFGQLITEMLAEDITDAANKDPNAFYRIRCGEDSVRFRATNCKARTNPQMRDEKKIELTGDVVVIDGTRKPARTLKCKRATLHFEGDELAPTLTMELYNARWIQGGISALTQRHVIRGLILPSTILNKFKDDNVLNNINLASTVLKNEPSGKLQGIQAILKSKIQKTFIAITAEIHSRLVFGIGCVTMILIGIGLGIIKKEGHMLAAFGISSVPAAILVICMISGKNVAKNPGSSTMTGLILIWSGLAFLTVVTIVIYRKLLKN